MADHDMVSRCPAGVELTHVRPGESLEGYDRVIASKMEDFRRDPYLLDHVTVPTTFWLHGIVHTAIPKDQLQIFGQTLNECRVVVCSPMGLAIEEEWLDPLEWSVNPGWMDTTQFRSEEKVRRALWAARPDPVKGLPEAIDWCSRNDFDLHVVMDVSRELVLQRMAESSHFILLSTIPDVGPRAVIEAQLSGCELIVNDNVGVFDEPMDELRARIDRADTEFWSLACE